MMGHTIDDTLRQLIGQADTVKLIVTVSRSREPFAEEAPHLSVNEAGQLIHLELLETSKTNRNLVHNIWFSGKAVVYLQNGRESYVVPVTPVKSIISGPVFERHYTAIRKKIGDVGLVAVWVLQPEEYIDTSFVKQKQLEEENRKSFIHLDRLAK